MRTRVGTDMTPKRTAAFGDSSTSTAPTFRRPWYSSASSSTIGASCLHGPHQTAEKSSRTGCGESRTSLVKLPSLTITTLDIIDLSLRKGFPGNQIIAGRDLTRLAGATIVNGMALLCPHCSAAIDGASLEGAGRCPFCGTVLYVEQGVGIPHRIASSCRRESDILRAASDGLRRAGRPGRPGAMTLYYIPYFVFEGEPGAQGWTGRAAVSLPVPALASIPIFGSDTRWFESAAAPQGALILEPTLDASRAAGA